MHPFTIYSFALAGIAPKLASAQWASTTTFTFDGETLPTGLIASTDIIDDLATDGSTAMYNHQFNASNVQVSDGFLQLIVPGGQTTSPIQCGEVSTEFEVLHGSVSTFAILTNESGICDGMFFYHSDSQEIDIEWISDPSSASNQDTNNGTRVMQYTNQGPHGAADAIEVNGRAPDDPTSAVHEYRVDWTEASSSFYLDGVFQQQIDGNVPTTSGAWVWNAWTDGDPEFTVGPPENDAVFRIQKIVMRYNTTADASQEANSTAAAGGSQSKGSAAKILPGTGVFLWTAIAAAGCVIMAHILS